MRKFIVLFAFFLHHTQANSQGCVAERNMAGFGQLAQLGYGQTDSKWLMDIDNRYFKAYHFLQGKTNITPSNLDDGLTLTEYTINFELSRILKNGWSVTLDMPISANEAAGKLEQASGEYHATHAYGIGDIRFTVYKWLLNTSASSKGNIQIGIGIKFPTGNYHSEDYFYDDPNNPNAKVLAPVDVAIQLGDGGTGITTQLNAFYIFNRTVGVYGNFFYLISPQDQNGVASWPPGLPPATDPLQHEITNDVNSVPDNYTLRAGANFTFNKLVATAGLRYEGAPAHDLIGENDGLRRVGHIFSLEPGLQYKLKQSVLYAFVTIPVERETIQTVPDERATEITGQYTITPGHFANYIVFVGYAFTL
jgi:hypothetical protein